MKKHLPKLFLVIGILFLGLAAKEFLDLKSGQDEIVAEKEEVREEIQSIINDRLNADEREAPSRGANQSEESSSYDGETGGRIKIPENEEEALELSKDIVFHLRNKYQNQDIVGYLTSGPGGIEEIIVDSNDNETYNRRNLWKEYSVYGTAFLWSANESIEDPYVTIFAHNMNNGEKFGKLNDSSYYPRMQTVDLYTTEGIRTFRMEYIFKVSVEEYDKIDTTKDYGIEELMELGLRSEIKYSNPSGADRGGYLVLSTCSVYGTPYRTVAVFSEIR